MQITPDLIKYLEKLARITLTEDEEKKVGNELQDILTYIDMLNELDTDGVEAMSHCFPVTNVMREDEVQPSMSADEIVANAPESQDGCFVVPKTVD
ncbi:MULTISPECIES: Asp-tRNA(Asn)/Glu-tRNA(Gln) amidotransferase subunit GatC [Eubacterium]|uniref:Aspartyl/glutamyl-tRNA(Asn/Gln) amidotransferase subunit C n=1 Tax=Eubacterium coprostanoligenes TaxID=290054 RepID=A0A1T4KH32_9FIRM|nr:MULTISPECIES: Asp-tRNA(Asn)/Glu-tRNA(Gln) amidotransferase subunit GatC [Eubacterium]MDO4363467.1 Asp-tRNA(Asn)/Glu-tRNA(Gln) amidotransferase subunit GatC [Clostridia bacterium]MCI6254815.1 Asp-tRNA(Asn)/Glu-tRNA(Gln) amidotransferase subunit GatC [Eubacterium coprostanoligenes]MCI6354817.1 Asp-tRNA(Asn)/Glu-tRNA(Gln) amidotransferase subunit GatC [Eubacterium coprostanoligenes]MCI6361141.1 Asp-tRNA(Asn)/Glu-tRNA(Gln) amidotransferase subunit GatC [Eubacterium coprostanoligenes]MCI7265105.